MVSRNWEGCGGHSCGGNEVVREGVPRGDQCTHGQGLLRKGPFPPLLLLLQGTNPSTHLGPYEIGPFLMGFTLGKSDNKF